MLKTPGVVIVGAGLAGAKVAEVLRQEGWRDDITIVGAEPEPPYERPGLSKGYLQGNDERKDLFVHDEKWYADHDVTTRFATTVESIDRDAKTVRLSSGEDLGYSHLVLATGSEPRTLDLPGADADGIVTLRTIGDSDRLREQVARAENVVVIGGGWIGLEVAAAAQEAGRHVTVLEAGQWPLGRVMGEEMAEYFVELHRRHGVNLRTSVQVTGFETEGGKVTGVEIGGAALPADLVVVGVGITPRVALAEAAGLDVDNGVLVDERMVTSDRAILAVGDIANAYSERYRERLRVEHWDNAIRQGELAAKSIAGRNDVYDWAPYFFTDQFDLGMEYVGHHNPDDEVVIRGDTSEGEFIAFWLRDGVVTGAMNVNIWDVNDDLRALLGTERSAKDLKQLDFGE